MTMRVVTVWRRELVNINKTRDNHLARFGAHFEHTLLVRDDKQIGSHISAHGTRIHRITAGRFGFIGFWLKALMWLRRQNSDNSFDAVIFPIGEEPLIMPARLLLGSRSKGPDLILDLWDVPGLALGGSDRTLLKAVARKTYLWLLPKLVNNANIVVSGVVSQPFLNMGVAKSQIIATENGVNVDQFSPGVPVADLWSLLPARTNQTIRLLYQGYIHEARGSVAMVNMVSKLRGTGYDVQLLLVGPSEQNQLSVLENAASQQGVQKYVSIHDGVDSSQIPGVIVEADICLCPLEDIEKFRWSYPVKIYEYMAMGKAVVASNLPGIERMIKNQSVGGCLYDSTDFANMADSVTWLIENPEKMKHIAKRGSEHARTKSWESIVGKLAKEIELKIMSHRLV